MKDILIVQNLTKQFTKKRLGKGSETIKVADNISFSIKQKETLVLAGESGSGKTSIARMILRAIAPDSGRIIFDDVELSKKENLKKIRTECQMIHQDPYSSINPRMTVLDIVKEPLEIHNVGNNKKRKEMVSKALVQVKLEPVDEIASKYPYMLSGGQRQRVSIARAIVTNPKLIIADEPVSMLDVSIRIEILELLKELQEKLDVAFFYITHDLSTASYIGDRIAILYHGKIVETGQIRQVLEKPFHPYTQALIDSISEPDANNLHQEKKIRIKYSKGNDVDTGCVFRARCPYAIEKCKKEPNLEEKPDNRRVACFVEIN